MSQQKTPVEISNFSKGFITEASPLTFPPDASVDESNFILNRVGSRTRRLGLDYEAGYVKRSADQPYTSLGQIDSGVFRWENVSDNPNIIIAVTWFGNKLYFSDLTKEAISSVESAPSVVVSRFSNLAKFSFTAVDGKLIVASGAEEIAILTYLNGVITVEYERLLIRDFFGVEDLYSNTDTGGDTIDLRDGNNIQFRPQFKTDQHVYNLRNQTWGGPKRSHREQDHSYDPIENFHSAAYSTNDQYTIVYSPTGPEKGTSTDEGLLPSNADITHYAMAPDADDNPPTDNFMARTLFDIPLGNSAAPKGFFIIDALKRGASRLEAYQHMMERSPKNWTSKALQGLTVNIDTLPADVTPNGPSVVEEFAGRVWYAGFSGDVLDGDKYSPKLSSYLLFSKLVDNPTDINKCYQEGDPTSEDTPDIIDSDGGYLRISGAYGIKKLVNLGAGLAVLAENGVWVVLGATSDAGFSATGFQVVKVSDYSILSNKSAVEVDNSLFYWSDDGIYILNRNDIGSFKVDNITQATIQRFYEGVPLEEKQKAYGLFDAFDRKVRWVYGGNKELVFDVNTGAFTKNLVASSEASVVAIVATPSYSIGTTAQDVVVSGVLVVAAGEQVQTSTEIRRDGFRSIKYLTVTDEANVLNYTFSFYNNQSFKDFEVEDGIGVDAEAYLISGYMNGGDNQREKQVPYLTTHMIQTESGFDSEFELLGQSSCVVSSQWDWTNNFTSNRWGREFQTYRLKRAYMSGDTTFDNGELLVTTKSKLRGRGKALSLRFRTEPDKDCNVVGWSMLIGTKSNV